MTDNIDTCPYCGKRVLRGAMRCIGCGKILKSPEEQMASIEKLKGTRKKSNIGAIIKFILLLFAIGLIYYFFSDKIIAFIRNISIK